MCHYNIYRVIFNEVIQTSKQFMRDVTVVCAAYSVHHSACFSDTLFQIKPEWLYELAPHFYEYGTVSYNMATGDVAVVYKCVCVCVCVSVCARECCLFVQDRELAEAKRRKTAKDS